MYKRLSTEAKIALIKRIQAGESVVRVCREAQVSRTILYKWLKKYYEAAPRVKKQVLASKVARGAGHFRKLSGATERRVLKLALKNPALSSAKISKLSGVSAHGVWNVLKSHRLNTQNLRDNFINIYGPSLVRSRLASDKLTMIRRFEAGEKITDLCREFGVSRAIFYRWLARYRQAPQEAQREALENLRPARERHWRFVPEARGLVLGVVVQAPELSPFQISRQVTAKAGKQILGAHGVYNLLSREGLNTIARRVQYASSLQQTPEVQIAPLYEPEIPMYRLRMLLAPFVTVPKLVFRRPPVGILVTLLTFLPLTLVFLWLRSIVNASSQTSIVGLFFASIALTFGIFFFIYSLKYYLSVLLVLKLASRGSQTTDPSTSSGQLQQLTTDPSANSGQARINPLLVNLEKVEVKDKPFVSIHVAVYNEKKVIGRLIQACTAQDWYQASSESKRLASSDNEASLNAERYTLNAKDNSANYEVVIVDDSTDETWQLALSQLTIDNRQLTRIEANEEQEIYVSRPAPGSNQPTVKLIHRFSRLGFKGGALQKALENTNPRAEYICVFDADFVPFPDTIEQFIKTFQVLGQSPSSQFTVDPSTSLRAGSSQTGQEKLAATVNHELITDNNIAAVQGYQWHVLNKSENWVTRGVRTEYAGSYVVERAGEEIYQGLKQIAGSVYAIRADILRAFGWGTSITEDFELTLRLYEAGYKVAFTPYIQAPAEAVSTVRRLIRQRMRWAEGASFNIKIMLSRMLFGHWVTSNNIILGSEATPESDSGQARMTGGGKVWVPSKLTLSEKLEFAYLSPYYLQAAFFVIGTLSWFISEAIFQTKLPFWSATFGWSLVFTNLLSLPLLNIVGLFLEESDERDYLGVFSFIALSYIMVPFQAYAAIKGFLESSEGPWFRTPKTGVVTDVVQKAQFYRWFGKLWPRGRAAITEVRSMNYELREKSHDSNFMIHNSGLALATVNSQLNSFYQSKRRKLGPFVNGIIIALLIFSITLGYLSPLIPERSEVSAQGDVGALNILKPGQVEAAGVRETEETLRPIRSSQGKQAQGEQKLPPELSQDFSWGVLAINFDQSIYLPGQETKIAFSVLDEKGVADCNAILALEIKDPQGAMTSLSAKDKTIQKSQSCGTLEATNEPDYFATYTPSTIGVYEAKFTAARSNDPVSLGKSRTIVDHFYVEEKPEVIVRREGPTRLYPANRYTMEFEIESLNDFSGQIKESVPLSFDVIHRDGMEIFQENGAKTLSWQKDLIKGVNYKFSYEFQGPEESPQFYLAGPLKLEADSSVIPHSMRDPELEAGTLDSRLRGNDNGSGNDNEESVVSGQSSNVAFQEARAWQLANDAQYNCTWNTGSGTWETAGNWNNCNGTYPANGADTYTATIDNASAAVTTGATAVTIDSLTVGGTNTSSLTLSFNLTVLGDVAISGNGAVSAGSTTMTVGGSWSNAGTFTAGTSTITFNTTTTGKTISGNLTGSSAFNLVVFDGSSSCTRTSAACWTIQDAMEVTDTGNPALDLKNGHLTLGNGTGDNLEVDGYFYVAYTPNQSAAFDTITNLAQGDSITIDINDAAAPACTTNCIVTVGAASGTGQGDFKIGKNVTLKFNSSGSVTSGLEVNSTGYLELQGSQDDTDNSGIDSVTHDAGATITLNDASQSWTANEHQNKHVRITNTSSLAFGKIYTISSNSTDSLTFADEFDTEDDAPTVSGSGPTYTITTTGTSLITANDQGIGQYIYNTTDNQYYKIVDSTDSGTSDQFMVISEPNTVPGSFSGKTIKRADGVRATDNFEILDYAQVTASAGTSCNASNNGYVYAQAGSETLVQYADICDMGADTTNKYGVSFYSVNGSNSAEGVKIAKSRIHDGYYGIYLNGSSNNNSTNSKGFSDSATYSNSMGFYLTSSSNNTLSSNTAYSNSSRGFYLVFSSNNTLSSNTSFSNQYGFISFSSKNNTLSSNTAHSNSISGFYIYSSSSNNILSANTAYSNTSYGFYLGTSSNNILSSNTSYSNTYGLTSYESTGNMAINDDYGVLGANTADIYFFGSSSASNLKLFNVDLTSSTEVTGVTYTGAYISSEKHDSTAGSTKIWGEYTVPDNNAETPNDEGTQKFNWVNNLYEDSATAHGYSGTGTQDTDIQITLTSALSAVEWYRAEVTTANGDTPVFTITRSGGTANPSTYTLSGTYTESATGVRFTIQDGATNYVVGDTYTFAVWPDSNDASSQKTLTMMQDGDTFTAGSGETVELKGQSGSLTTVSASTGNYSFSVSGTIDASYFSMTGLGASGLNIGTGATVTNLANCSFDNNGTSGGGSDTHITAEASVISSNATFADCSFGDTNGYAEYNVTLTGTPGSNWWVFSNATGALAGEANDNDDGNPGVIRWDDSTGAVVLTGTVYTDEGSTNIGAGKTVTWALGGTTKDSDDTDSSGVYSISTFETISSGNILTFYLNDETGDEATMVTKTDGSTFTGLHLYEDRVIVRADIGSIANSDLATGDNGDDDVHYQVTAGVLDVEDSFELHIWTGDTFAPGGNVTIGGSYHNTGTVTWSTYTTTFDTTTTGQYLSGTLNGTSAFYSVVFNGSSSCTRTSAACWTIQDAMEVTSTAATALDLQNGRLTLGNGTGDNLEVDGGFKVAATADQAAAFDTITTLAQGNSITIDVNDAAAPTCGTCIITVGASSGSGQGDFKIGKNVTLKFNSSGSVTSGIQVESTGYLEINGGQDATGTSDGTTDETTITDTTKSWTTNEHQNKVVRITLSSSLAFGKIYNIDSNTGTALTRTDNSSATDTNPDVTGGTACSGAATCTINIADDLITASDQGIGRYLHNLTDDDWYRIVDSAEAATDTITIVTNTPDDFTTMGDGDDVEISDGVRTNDQYEILDYAQVTASAGTSCNATNNGYIYAKAGSDTLIQYADICDLGASGDVNKYGISLSSVNGSNANEGVKIAKSRIYNGYRGIHLNGSSNNNTANSAGFTDNAVYSNSSSSGFGLTSSSNNNTLSSNIAYSNAVDGFSLVSSSNNTLSSNISYSNSYDGFYLVSSSKNNILSSNTAYSNSDHGFDLTSSSNNNTLSSNTAYGNSDHGFYFNSSSNNNTLFSNTSYSNTYGLASSGSTNNVVINDDYGVLGGNAIDIFFYYSASNLKLYNVDLASSDEAYAAYAGAYIISEKHDSTAGLTKIWGEYTVPDNNAETPNDEGTQKFNYANNLYEDSATPHGYSGTGTQDTDIQITLTTVLSAVEWYRAEVTTANGDTPVFTITRSGGTASPSTYTLPGTYTESATGVQFTIQDGATNYVLGDTYTFAVWPDSSDTDTQKSLTVMQTGDTITAGTGETIELQGTSAVNQTLVQKNTGVTSYSFSVTGTINANYYKITGTDSSGLNIGTGATVTNLTNGVFDDTGGTVGGNSTYITVASGVLDGGAATWAGVTFDDGTADANIKYNVTLSGTPSACSNTWKFYPSSGNFGGATNGEANDSDTGDGGGCSGGAGYVLWAIAGDISGKIYGTDETTFIGNPPCDNLTQIVSLRVNGGIESTTTCTDGGGSADYSFGGITVSAGDTVTVYLTSTQKANLVMVADSNTVTNANLFQDRVIVRDEQDGTATNADMSDWDNDDDATNMLFTANTNTLDTDSATELHIWTGDTFAPGGNVTVSGSYHNVGTATWSTYTTTFDSTTTGQYLSGTLTGSSAFYSVVFNGSSSCTRTSAACWTIQDAMEVTSTAATALDLQNGRLTLGNGTGDDLEVDGGFKVAVTADQAAAFDTITTLAQGDSITIDVNDSAAPACATNCIVTVGASSGSGQGDFKISKNVTLKFNSSGSVTSGLEVESTGYLEINGGQEAGTSDGTTDETTITDTSKSWSTNEHQNKVVRMTSGLAIGKIYNIDSNTATALTRTDNSSATDTNPNVVVGSACSGNATCTIQIADDLITASNEGVGRYLHNLTDDKWYRIVNSTEAAQDALKIVTNTPDDFTTMGDGDDIEISDGVKVNDTYEILDYAQVTASAGTSCNASNNGYVWAKAGSETLIQYADICDMGADTTNKYGVSFYSVNGANSAEGVKIAKSRIHDGQYGIFLDGSLNNNTTNSKGFSDSAIYSNSQDGIFLGSSSSNNTVSSNTSYSNSNNGITFFSSSNNTLSSNTSYSNSNNGINLSSNSNNTLSSNTAYSNADTGFYLTSSSNNTLSSNTGYSNSNHGFLLTSSSNNNTLSSNTAYNNTSHGFYLVSSNNNTLSSNTAYANSSGFLSDSSSNNTFSSNTAYSNSNPGLYLSISSNNNILFSNSSYSNNRGLRSDNSTGNVVINDDYGVSGANTNSDIYFVDSTAASTLSCYSCDLASSTEVTGVTYTGAYIISEKHDSTAGSTKIWGEYTIPDNNAETPNDEGTQKFNYSNNLWENSMTEGSYSGSGSEDTVINQSFSGSWTHATTTFVYRITCRDDSVADCDSTSTSTNAWDVFRNEVDIGDVDKQETYTDSDTGARFTFDGGSSISTAYATGDTYKFAAWKASGDTSSQKTITMMQDGDTFTAGSGETVELKGQSSGANRTTVSANTGNYGFTVGGTINAYYYDFTGVNTSGLNITSTATVTDLHDGSFDNFATGANYITVAGITSNKTWANLAFDPGGGDDATYNINADGSGITWDICFATGSLAGEDYDNEANGAIIGWPSDSAKCIATSTGWYTQESWQRKTFYETTNGIYWTFFYTGGTIAYYYSNDDGTTWNSGGTLSCGSAYYSIWYAGGTTVYIACLGGSSDILVNKGTTSASSISWGTAGTALDGGGGGNSYIQPFISRDSSGYLWVVARYYDCSVTGGDQYCVRAVRSTNADDQSTWDTLTTLSDTSNTDPNNYSVIVPLSSQNMYAVWVRGTAVEGKEYVQGSGWDASATSIGSIYSDGYADMTDNISAVSTTGSPDRVHLIYPNTSTGYVIYDQWNSTDNNWTSFSDVTLDSGGENTFLTLSLDTATSDLYAFWVRSSVIYYKKGVSPYNSGNWDVSATAFKSNGNIRYTTSNYSGSSRIFVTWTQGTTSPNSILWKYVIVPERLLVLLGFGPLLPLFLRRKRRRSHFRGS